MNKKYDIGILTFWNVPNYGTFAQAYALQKVIEKLNKNLSVKQISHLDEKHYNFYYDKKKYDRCTGVTSKSFWKSFFKYYDNKNVGLRKNIFLDAYNSIPHTDIINYKNGYNFKKIYIGSDIVWDYSIDVFNKDRMLFGEGLHSQQLYSYAASFGTVTPNDCFPNYVKDNISRFNNISVRDENSANIIEKITGNRPEIVMDPTWLWDFNSDSNVQIPNEDNYILVYGQNFTDKFIDNLVAYAKEKNMQIIALDCNEDKYAWCDKLIEQKDLSPYLWIGYFKKANAIATSTFHGLTFGMIFKKKIAFSKTDFIMAKIKEFLKKINIYHIFENTEDVKFMLDYNWNYDEIDKKIDIERKKSIDYLRRTCK